MKRTITRLFNSHTEAMQAVQDLERAGVHHDDISIVADNSDDWHGKGGGRHDDDGDNDTAEGAGKGATTGGLLGGGAGLLAGLGMLAIPGLGPVVAAGWLASTAAGAVAGAVAGGATGGLLGALKDAGHSEEDAHVYSEGVRRGGSLVSVKADESMVSQIEDALNRNTGVGADTRGAAYRQSGWSKFDESAPAYSSEDRMRERTMYSGR